nr:MAG TPA: hypothetical protein [Caudoviricetes sp.]DAW04242.1 MAG TPA: hypothetical protein [Caudoviricetes sp.]
MVDLTMQGIKPSLILMAFSFCLPLVDPVRNNNWHLHTLFVFLVLQVCFALLYMHYK